MLRKCGQLVRAIAATAVVALVAGLVVMLLVDLAVSGYGVLKAIQADGIGKAVGQIESQTIISLAQGVATIVAIAIGGAFAYYRLGLFRQTEPHLTVTQEVSHRYINPQHIQVAVTTTLLNASNVKVEVRSSLCTLSQVAPLEPTLVESIYAAGFGGDGDSRNYELAWPVLDFIPRAASPGQIIIEPGGSYQMVYEFVVLSSVRSVAAVTFVYNEKYEETNPDRSHGWTAYTVYDIVD